MLPSLHRVDNLLSKETGVEQGLPDFSGEKELEVFGVVGNRLKGAVTQNGSSQKESVNVGVIS